ncbi:MAG TPA: SRPBCC family protein [Chryseolinea sp.]|nr:SRPBCC family protein [Chryseolinea sp.]
MKDEPLIVKRNIDIAAEASTVWDIIVSPAFWSKWMMVPPALEPDQTTIDIGSEVKWRNEHGETYLTGTVTTLDRESCLVLELDDVSWTRRAAPGEVTYSLKIMQDGNHTHVEFRLGDLSIDPEGREWHQSYVDSRELEKIKELAEANQAKK